MIAVIFLGLTFWYALEAFSKTNANPSKAKDNWEQAGAQVFIATLAMTVISWLRND